MVMRLVRDDDEVRGEFVDESSLNRPRNRGRDRRNRNAITIENEMPADGSEEQPDPVAPADGGTDPATGNGRAAEVLDAQAVRAETPEPAAESPEQPDGAVDSGAEAEAEADDESAEPVTVNLAAMEALLLSTHHPLTAPRLAELLELPSIKPIRHAVRDLNDQYASTGRCFRVEQVAGGYQILTQPEFGDILKRLHQKEGDAKLTKAALETLSIIAYKQPILRADIEAIRGVACGETIRSLMEKHLVKIAGRAEEPGRPILYGTTKRFLELFGLNSLKDLPQPDANKPPA